MKYAELLKQVEEKRIQAIQGASASRSDSMLQCMIPRESDELCVAIGIARYVFKKSEHGHLVCAVHNVRHFNWLLRSGHYRPYTLRQ